MSSFRDRLAIDLARDEGFRGRPYRDTVDKLTIGFGRNLDDVRISFSEAGVLLENDIHVAIAELDANLPWWRDMPEPARRALANMCFNMGWPTLRGFKRMLHALEQGKYRDAKKEALDSRWAKQVGVRVDRIGELFVQATAEVDEPET